MPFSVRSTFIPHNHFWNYASAPTLRQHHPLCNTPGGQLRLFLGCIPLSLSVSQPRIVWKILVIYSLLESWALDAIFRTIHVGLVEPECRNKPIACCYELRLVLFATELWLVKKTCCLLEWAVRLVRQRNVFHVTLLWMWWNGVWGKSDKERFFMLFRCLLCFRKRI